MPARKHFVYILTVILGLLLVCETGTCIGQEEWQTKDGKKFTATYLGTCIGAIGFHRKVRNVKIARSYYLAGPAGIFVQCPDKKWMDYEDFLKSYDRRISVAHVLSAYKSTLKPKNGNSAVATICDYLTSPPIVGAMRKNKTKNVWFYCRFARFETKKNYTVLIPISRFGGAKGNQMHRGFDQMKQSQTQAQLQLINLNQNQFFRAHRQLIELLPTTGSGPDWMAVAPDGVVGIIAQQIRNRMQWQLINAEYRRRYLAILFAAK